MIDNSGNSEGWLWWGTMGVMRKERTKKIKRRENKEKGIREMRVAAKKKDRSWDLFWMNGEDWSLKMESVDGYLNMGIKEWAWTLGKKKKKKKTQKT